MASAENRDSELLTAQELWERNPVEAFDAFCGLVVQLIEIVAKIHDSARIAANHNLLAIKTKFPDYPSGDGTSKRREYLAEQLRQEQESWLLRNIQSHLNEPLVRLYQQALDLWKLTPIPRFLALEQPVSLAEVKGRPIGTFSGCCYHDIGLHLADHCSAVLHGNGCCSDYVAKMRFATAAGNDVTHYLSTWLTAQVRCELRGALAKLKLEWPLTAAQNNRNQTVAAEKTTAISLKRDLHKQSDYLARLIALLIKTIRRGFDHHTSFNFIVSIPRQETFQGVKLRYLMSDDEISQMDLHSRRRSSALYWIRKLGRRLAVELENAGHNSTQVLAIVSRADGGGGMETIGKIWEPIKVELQRIALLSRPSALRASKSEATPESQDSGLDSIPNEIRANDFKLFPKGPLSDRDLTELVLALNTHKNSGKSLNQIAREYYEGTGTNWKSRLSSVRRLRNEGRANF